VSSYILTYDLVGEPRRYQPLWDALRRDNAVTILQSAWVVRTGESSVALRDRYRQYIDSNDRLWISEVVQSWAYYNITNPEAAKRLLPGG
jgi:hypothetical protein